MADPRPRAQEHRTPPLLQVTPGASVHRCRLLPFGEGR
jgi:hypothetical protein